jgi:NTP pyrophosphatase (non-canonical NTP hydrolase)
MDLPVEQRMKVAEEMADVLLYLVRLADKLGVDLKQAAHAKLEVNEKKYPADRVRGSSKKYTDL